MGRPKKLSINKLKQCREVGFKTAIVTGIELDDFDRIKLELTKRGFFILKCGNLLMADCATDWNNIKHNLSKDESLKWIFYYFKSNGERVCDKKGGRKMKIFEKITDENGKFEKECPTEFKVFLEIT
jgi:hypothetical protein